MRARGHMFPSEDEIYWEYSATRDSADGKSLEFKHVFLTHEAVRNIREQIEALGDECLETADDVIARIVRRGTERVDVWREGCVGRVQ